MFTNYYFYLKQKCRKETEFETFAKYLKRMIKLPVHLFVCATEHSFFLLLWQQKR